MRRYLIILLLLLSSCGARKVAIVKNDTKITIDSTAIVKTDSTATTQNNIVIDNQSQEIEISPIDNSKEIFINNIPYKNARIRIKNTRTKQSDTSFKKVALVKEKTAKKTIEKKVSIKEKHIDKKTNYFIYLWLLLIPVGMYIYRQIKNKLFL
jgi:hypothetical protein